MSTPAPPSGQDARTRNELGGTVYGPSIMARDIRGDVHVHNLTPPAPPPPGLPPSQLPQPVQLTGRTRDLEKMATARASRVIVVTGQPGVGKTSLAIQWGHQVRGDFPDGVLYADLHGYAPDGPASPAEELARFLRALGVGPQHVPADLAELTAMYRSLTVDRRMLVVLDDALTAAQVIPLLPPSPASVAVVTSRSRLGGLVARGARVIQLDRLDDDAALELLARTLGDDRVLAEPYAARELVELCARVPLALCVAGARLAARARWPISELVHALTHERRRLAALALEDDDMAVRPALDVSYQALAPGAARMYRVMGLFTGVRFDSGIAACAATVAPAEAKRLLSVLTNANLLDDAANGQYQFHDLTKVHARELAEQHESEADRAVIVRRMLDWFLASAGAASDVVTPYRSDLNLQLRYAPGEPARFAGPGAALDWLDRELPNVMAAARLAVSQGHHTAAWQISDAMWPLFLYRGHYTERLELDELALTAARAAGDAAGEAKMLNRLGLAVMDLGQPERAQDYYGQALAIWERLGDANRIAGGLRRLGLAAAAGDRPADAIELFARALDGYTRLGATRQAALTLSDLGDMLARAGRLAEAIARLTEAGDLLATEVDPYNQARTLYRLGEVHEQAGDLDAAAGYLQRALYSMRDIGSLKGQADALLALGGLAVRAGRPGEARDRYADARQILISVGSPRLAEVTGILTWLDQPDAP
jgi:tetratricopeptide (TPR) repeat protein